MQSTWRRVLRVMLQGVVMLAVWQMLPSHQAEAKGAGRTYYVAPSGRAQAHGTATDPFRTIQAAADRMEPGDRCIIAAGIYRETVRPKRSGRKGAPIVFQAAPGADVCLSGADALTAWRQEGDTPIWSAPMPWTLEAHNQVFCDEQMLPEARWPKQERLGDVWPSAATYDAGGPWGLQCTDLPDGLTDAGLRGAVVWISAGVRWTCWTSTLERYDPAEKKLYFPLPELSWARELHHPGAQGHYGGPLGHFYITGSRELLTAPGEWAYDRAQQRLYCIPPADAAPGAWAMEAKRREWAFDLSERSYVAVQGIRVHAASINLTDAHNCLVQGMRAQYIWHTRGGQTDAGLHKPSGIPISGSGNVLRDSEIAYSAGAGIELQGEHNAVINCDIHDIGYLGSYAAPVDIRGYANMLSHCTVREAGRDVVHMNGQAHLIEYCDLSRCGRLTDDCALFYSAGQSGGGTEIRYNWMHDTPRTAPLGVTLPGKKAAKPSHRLAMGLYIDNFTSNYLAHHNVIWTTEDDGLRMNLPSTYNVAVHNTIVGNIGNWGRWENTNQMYVLLQNNLVTGRIMPAVGLWNADNQTKIKDGELQKAYTDGPRLGEGRGRRIPGISFGVDATVTQGAYEVGQPVWTPGHDFANPPQATYALSRTPVVNAVANGSFDHRPPESLAPWQLTDARSAEHVRCRSSISTPPEERDSFIGFALRLQGAKDDGVRQTITGLQPNTDYRFSARVRFVDAGALALGVRGKGITPCETVITPGQPWDFVSLPCRTTAKSAPVEVYLRKRGPGAVLIDDVGLVPELKEPEK